LGGGLGGDFGRGKSGARNRGKGEWFQTELIGTRRGSEKSESQRKLTSCARQRKQVVRFHPRGTRGTSLANQEGGAQRIKKAFVYPSDSPPSTFPAQSGETREKLGIQRGVSPISREGEGRVNPGGPEHC